MYDVPQAVQPVVSAAVWNQNGLFIAHADKPGGVAPGRSVRAVRPIGGQHGEGRGLHECPVIRVKVINLFFQGGRRRPAIDRLKRLYIVDSMILVCFTRLHSVSHAHLTSRTTGGTTHWPFSISSFGQYTRMIGLNGWSAP